MSSMQESDRNKRDHSMPKRRPASVSRGIHKRLLMAACCPLWLILLSPSYVPGFTTQRVVSGLDRPLFVTSAPGDFDRLFIVEQGGRIQCWEMDSSGVSTFLDISGRVSCCGEQGLLGLAFHPAYATNGRFFVNYTDADGDTVVAEFAAGVGCSTVDAATETRLLTLSQQNSRHNGGWIGFGPDGFLYIATGDGAAGDCDAGGDAQDPGNLLGKVLRIDVDGAKPYVSPPGNPFVGQNGRDEVWALGLRNPWRCAFDRETGDFYIADVGQHAWEEVNVQPASSVGGENYGWNCMEGNHCSTDSGCDRPACKCFDASLTDPVIDFDHSHGSAIIGGEVYRGCAIDDLAGTYFLANGNSLWSFQYVDGLVEQFVERTDQLAFQGTPLTTISSFGLDAYGEIYICNLVDGEVFKIVPDEDDSAPDCDGNGVADSCESLASGSALLADCNADGVVDLCDYADFAPCMLGPVGGLGAVCKCFDTNFDCNVTLKDYATLQSNIGDLDCPTPGCTVDPDCDDGAFCNGAETCVGGSCQAGTPFNCNDGIACTVDSCDEGTDSCDYVANNANCDDGLFCNGAESCSATLDCRAGTAPNCDDGVGCTDDSCNEGTDSCDNIANNASCDDGLFCNGSETCNATLDCQAGSDPCPGQICDEATDTCNDCTTNGDCDDGLFCNGAESCVGGSCLAGTAVNCGDGVGCSDDSCNEGTDSCDNVANNANCDDGLFCNGAETCNATLDCQAGTAPNCDDSVACTDDSCNEGTDSCDNIANNANCDDGVACTIDDCAAGACQNTPDNGACPDDGQFCNGTEFCDAVSDCSSTGYPCGAGEYCNETTDTCDPCTPMHGSCSLDAECCSGICRNNGRCR